MQVRREGSFIEAKSHYEYYVLDTIRAVIRPFFFPFLESIPPAVEQQQEIEKDFFMKFWDPKAPLRPELVDHGKVKEKFTCRKEVLPICIKGTDLMVICSIIESKDCGLDKECYNFVHVLGITSTADNDIMRTYPLLATYLEMKDRPPARFVLISQYETRLENGSLYKPQTLDGDVGQILCQTLKSLEKKYGIIHQLLGYSLGSIVAAAALRHFDGLKENSAKSLVGGRVTVQAQGMPKHITFDRGPSSVEELSKLYTGGCVLLPLSRISGWDMDFGKEIAKFVRALGSDAPSITVINALQDHRFGNKVNLYENPYIKELKAEGKISAVLVDQPLQCAHQSAHHSTSLEVWNKHHVVEGTDDLLGNNKNLAHAILERSMPKTAKKSSFFSWFAFAK